MKKVFVETYGCQMNEYDTELVRSILSKDGFDFTRSMDSADIVMLNTCAVRENAHRKVYGRIQKIHSERKGNPAMIGILGCMATNLREDLLKDKHLNVGFIAGPDSYKQLPGLIRDAYKLDEKPSHVSLSEYETYSDIVPSRKEGANAWIAIMRGCNNFCTFCVVPYTRGRERSRSVANIVDEVKRLADDGFKQVTLLGQNVNSYQHENDDFADLLEATSRVNGIERIRFTSPHPKDFPEKVLEIIAHHPKVCNQFHIPLQAGNDRVLDMMNRTYTQDEFLKIIDQARTLIPDVALSTDIIVGFPTETDAEFEDTVKVMKEVEFDSAFIFKYSERKNTIAASKFPDDVPEEAKTERIVKLNELQTEISLKKNEAHIGQVQSVLVEEVSTTKSKDHYQARTDGNKRVILPACNKRIGDFVDVKITEASPHVLRGHAV